MIRKGLFLVLVTVFSLSTVMAQDITGVWKTIDDRTGDATSHVEIYKEAGVYYGKVVEMLRDDPSSLCVECRGKFKNQPIMGMVILRDLVKEDDYWTSGYILDPENGKEYKCNIHLDSDNQLTLRGYIGAPMFGRSQKWHLVQ